MIRRPGLEFLLDIDFMNIFYFYSFLIKIILSLIRIIWDQSNSSYSSSIAGCSSSTLYTASLLLLIKPKPSAINFLKISYPILAEQVSSQLSQKIVYRCSMQPNRRVEAYSTIFFMSSLVIAIAAFSSMRMAIYFRAVSTRSLWLFVNILRKEGIGALWSMCSVWSSYSKLNFLPMRAGYSS